MKFFLDTEFSERGRDFPVKLISIGIVSEDGREFYAASDEFTSHECSQWVRDNVLPHIGSERISVDQIAAKVREFVCSVTEEEVPEFWGYYCDYDWVVFAQMFGTMMDLPSGWPMYCRDLKQLCDEQGSPEIPKQESTEHNALADARWNKQAYEFLRELTSGS